MTTPTPLKVLGLSMLTVVIVFLAVILAREAWDYTIRLRLFPELQPVQLKNCELKRFGLWIDEGYLLCDNLLRNMQVIYSYGIDGRDGFGCETSTRLGVPVHQYDCFNLTRPVCDKANAIFHEECVGEITKRDQGGRLFDTVQNQITKNNDAGRTFLLKMDIEGAEWESLLTVPDEILRAADQIALEFHFFRRQELMHLDVIKKLKKSFYVVHIHFNNNGCSRGLDIPFPSYAFQVLLVNKRIGVLDEGKKPLLPNPLDEKDNPSAPDCQSLDQESRYQILRSFVREIKRLIFGQTTHPRFRAVCFWCT
jgi:hypothetical protein